jgi:glycosyltransferase involved in cell wall biosynthesis
VKVSIIIPALNEEKNLPFVLPKIPRLPEITEVILIDGHSSDDTVRVAKELLPEIKVIFQKGKGKGDALKCGWKHASGDVVVTLDADGSARPEEIPEFIEPLLQGYHLVKGSRFLPGGGTLDMPRHRRFGNRAFTIMTNIFFSTGYTDLVYGYHAFHKNILEGVELESDDFIIDTELYIKAKKAGLKVVEVPSFENKRISGKGDLRSLRDGWGILKTIFRERFHGRG